MKGFLPRSFKRLGKLFTGSSVTPFDLKQRQVFAVYDNGFREYQSKTVRQIKTENESLLNRIWLISDFTYEQQQKIIDPFIIHFIALCGPLPASENTHDLYSGGLVRHSLTVCVNALHLLERSRYTKEECRAYDAAIVYAALAHDLAKIYTDCEIRGEDGTVYQPFDTDFETFAQEHARSFFYIRFLPQRSTQHKNCLTQNSTLLLKDNHTITDLMSACLNKEEVLNGSNEIWDLVRQADTRTLYAVQSLGSYSVDVFSFIRAELLSFITTGKYSCNKADSQLFFIPQGLLVRRDSEVYDELHATHFALTHGFALGPGYEDADRFSISLRSSGMVALCSAHAAFSWHRLLLDGRMMYVEGLVLLIKRPEGIPCCDWYPRGRQPFEIEELLQDLEEQEGRPAVSLTLKHPYDFIRKFDLDDLATDETVYGKTTEEKNALTKKNCQLKRREKIKSDREALQTAKEAAQHLQIITDGKTDDEVSDSNGTAPAEPQDKQQVISFKQDLGINGDGIALLPRRGRGRPKGSRNRKTLEKPVSDANNSLNVNE